MAQFQVPQFIEIEQKIILGQFTMRQFLIMAIGAGVIFILFLTLNFIIWLFFAVIVGVGIFAVAFLKINGRSFSLLLKAAFFYYWNPSFYLWRAENEYKTRELETRKITKTSLSPSKNKLDITVVPRRFGISGKPEGRVHIGEEDTPTQQEPEQTTPEGKLDHKETRERLKIGAQIQSLWEKISTTRDIIPKRESRMNAFQKERVETGYEVMRRSTGEIEMAKRVDFT